MSVLVTWPVPAPTRLAQANAADPDRSVWVSANAGSGKTHVLTQRVLRLLLAGVPPGRILCLTFTKAAAATMAARVFEALARWTMLDDAALRAAIVATGAGAPDAQALPAARRLFARTVETPGGLKIQTIHAFCERLLHVFPFEANVPARFEVLDDRGRDEAMALARRDVLVAAMNEASALGAALSRVTAEASGADLDRLIGEAMGHRARAGRRAGPAREDDLRRALGLADGLDVAAIERAIVEDGIAPDTWRSIAGFLATGSVSDQKRAALFEQAHRLYALAAALPQCCDVYRDIFFTQKGEPAKSVLTAPLARQRPDLEAAFRDEQERLARCEPLRKAAAIVERTMALTTIVDAIFERYDALKGQRGLLDFSDLVERTLALLERSDAQWVLYKLDAGIDHILVDEAQDTSAAQWRIFEELTADYATGITSRRRSFFAVGDDKQSIFSFQGAAPHMFHEMRRRFGMRFKAAKRPLEHVQLTLSFRSVPAILSAVDTVFARGEHQVGLVSSDDRWMGHDALKRDLPGLVELWPPAIAEKVETSRDWRLPLDIEDARDPANIVAERVARKIAALTALVSPDRVHDKNGRPRSIRAGDILVLVRTRGPFFDAVIRALKQKKVPVAGADRLDLGGHIATLDLVAAGRAALLPDDDLTIACVLKSPLIGLDDGDLLQLAPRRKGSLFEALSRAQVPRHVDAHRKIVVWCERARRLTPFAFYMALLGADGGRRAMEARLGGEAADAMDEFLRLALQHEREPSASLETFLASLEGFDLSIRRDMETAGNEVRVMTVHAAKGLESKIVFLPDTCSAPEGRHDPRLFALGAANGEPGILAWSPRKDADSPAVAAARAAAREAAAEEYRRLLYVALTRAEEQLYVAGFQGRDIPPAGSWSAMIAATLGDDFDLVPAFWGDGEFVRRRVLGKAARVLPAAEASGVAASSTFPEWLHHPAPPENPARPPLRPSSPLAAGDRLAEPSSGGFDRTALRRGRLMHALLQYLPEVAPPQRQDIGRRFLAARAADLDDADVPSLLEDAERVIGDPALAALFGPGARAEVAVAGHVMHEGIRLDVVGQVDRLAETDGDILVADFKTGLPKALEETPETYRRQMALYRAVLAPLWPGKRLRMLIVWTAGPMVVELDEARLSLGSMTVARERHT